MTTILERIIETKRAEVAEARRRRPIDALRRDAAASAPARGFAEAVTPRRPGDVRLIAEVKRASPSAGILVPNFDPVGIAREYHAHGASALSVLTDETYFQGRLDFIHLIKEAVPLPVLRKDFLIDEYQLYESRAAGADAVLLIAEVLGADGVAGLFPVACSLGMSVLVEVHTAANLSAVLNRLGPPASDRYLLGINNRDLAQQRTDVSTFIHLAAMAPPGSPLVAESGLRTAADVSTVGRAGAWAILVGESILRTEDRGRKIRELLSDVGAADDVAATGLEPPRISRL